LIDSLPHVVWTTRPDGYTDYLNQRGAELLGLPAESIHGWGWLNLLHPDDAAPARRLWERAYQSGTPYRNEYRVRHADGSFRWILAQATPLIGGHGTIEKWVGTWTDIDDLKRAESELRFRDRAIHAVSQGIVLTDPAQDDNPIVFASESFERLTGYPTAESTGRNCRFLQGKDTDPVAVSRIRAAIERRQSCRVELLNYRKDGTPFWNEVAISPVHDDTGRLVHFVGTQTDVTERRRLAEQYRQAQRMEAIGQLAGGVAHDFNNLLTIINGYSDVLLASCPADDPARPYLEEIRKAGERSAALTRQLLAFSRKQIVAPKLLDLNDVVRDTRRMLERLIGEHIRIDCCLGEELGLIRANRGQIEQLLLNLVVNARDAMPQGGTITLETSNVVLDDRKTGDPPGFRVGQFVRLAVSDTGVGMVDEIQRRIFEPFFTTKAPGKGTGLGLAVVHGIVQQTDGRIEVESRPGRGSTFRVYLPRVEGPVQLGRSAQGLASPPRGVEVILLVEDDPEVRRLARFVLEDAGYSLIDAANAEQALDLVARLDRPPDLLLTDVVLPGLNGRHLAERLRLQCPGLRVLFMSGYADDDVVRQGLLFDEVELLLKPFAPSVLVRRVRDILDR
jgi:PAS domain S-box-containing protein